MLFVITGDGKGKTTSALGMVTRQLGNNLKCLVLQFIKSNVETYGEYKSLTSMGVDWKAFGEGFTWNLNDTSNTAKLCQEGFDLFCREALSKKYSMIVLDEFTYPLSLGFVSESVFIEFIKANKDKEGFPHVVVTGRGASEKIIEIADTVSEISVIKHHYDSNGNKVVKGIEF